MGDALGNPGRLFHHLLVKASLQPVSIANLDEPSQCFAERLATFRIADRLVINTGSTGEIWHTQRTSHKSPNSVPNFDEIPALNSGM